MEMLTDKVALITGGSSGIGAETARVFAKQGAKVAIFARGREKLDQVAAELKALGAECLTITGDVTKSEDCNAAIDRVVTAFGRIDVLVNNAGAGDFHTTTEKCSDEFWDRMIALNQSSVLYCCRAVLPHMRAQGSGSIVNLSAIAGVYGNAGVSYSAAKAAVIAMTKNIALQYTGTDIRCNAVCPGPTAVDRMDGREDALIDQEFFAITDRHMDSSIPFASAEDQANVIAFLASDLSRCITGQAIVTDNGRCL